jgi:hypothetical protein
MKILRLLLIAPFFACTALVAQNAVPAVEEPTAPVAPAQAPAPAAQADPAAAESVLAALHFDEMTGKALNQQKEAALAYTRQMLKRMNLPGTSPQDLEAFARKTVDAAWVGLKAEEIHAVAVSSYAETFTTDELRAIANFSNSPAGQAFFRKQSEAQQKIMADLRPLLMQVMPKIQQMAHDYLAQQQAKAAEDAAKAATATAAPAASAAAPKP